MKPKTLPDKLSALIRLAVKDARLLSKNPKYKLDMSVYHGGADSRSMRCAVCMAGAVMACELRVPRKRYALPHDMGIACQPLHAINAARCGGLANALGWLRAPMPSGRQARVVQRCKRLISRYYGQLDGGRAPWHVYLRVARELEAVGL